MAPISLYPNRVKLPSHPCHTLGQSRTQTCQEGLPEIASRVWATAESQREKSAQLSELTRRTRSSSGMTTVARDSTNRRSKRFSGPITERVEFSGERLPRVTLERGATSFGSPAHKKGASGSRWRLTHRNYFRRFSRQFFVNRTGQPFCRSQSNSA
jgi:hypothetical protein